MTIKIPIKRKSIDHRSWIKYITIDLIKTQFSISIENYLVKYQNETTNRLGASVSFMIELNPKYWEISQSHIWYDGPNCFYNFGPFSYSSVWGKDCKKCQNED